MRDSFNYSWKSFAPKGDSNLLKKVKGTNPSLFPPFGPVIKQKNACVNYVTYIWKHAHEKHPNEDFIPEEGGWKLSDGDTINWYDGEEILNDICLHLDVENTMSESDNDSCSSTDDSYIYLTLNKL